MSAPEQVTITTWNCYRGPIDAKLRDLAYLNADIVALQECAEPEKQTPTFVWSGRSSIQGLALAVRPGLTVRALPLAKGPPHALMARVEGDFELNVLVVWAHPEPTYAASTREVVRAYGDVLRSGPSVVVGDFNSSPRLDEGRRGFGHAELAKTLSEEVGLVSAYHVFQDVAEGSEPDSTLYWRFQEDSPFHIDYVFVPEEWASRISSVEVALFDTHRTSDHRPLTVTIGSEVVDHRAAKAEVEAGVGPTPRPDGMIHADLPYDLQGLKGYFEHSDGGTNTSTPERWIARLAKSIQDAEVGAKWSDLSESSKRPNDYRKKLQFFKDETVLTLVAFAALDRLRGADAKAGRIECLDGFMRAALRDSWRGFAEPKVWLERQAPAPERYVEASRDGRLVSRHPVRYVREVGREGSRIEGPTHVDAWIGDGETRVFVEAKFLSDVSDSTTNDPDRNQIARNIDAGLELVNGRAEDFYFVLLTPGRFRSRPSSRLYAYKIQEYWKQPDMLARDLPHWDGDVDWHRLSRNIGWATWEDVAAILAGSCAVEGDERGRLAAFFAERGISADWDGSMEEL